MRVLFRERGNYQVNSIANDTVGSASAKPLCDLWVVYGPVVNFDAETLDRGDEALAIEVQPPA
jgi:hypothetical protein